MASAVVKDVTGPTPEIGRRSRLSRLPMLVVMILGCYLAPRIQTGADTMWMVALGHRVATTGSIPAGVPFAAADTTDWPNVPVVGELAMFTIHSLGPASLAVTLLLLGASSLLISARTPGRRIAHPAAAATTLGLAGIGLLPVLGVVRAPMLSLVPFTLLLLLLRSEAHRPTRRIWLVVPLTAIWGNLHGGVLVGVALTGCYLLLDRLRVRPYESMLVGLATVAAVWANPALLLTGGYYLGVLSNEAAQRGTELWAPPSLSSTFDILMLVAGFTLGLLALARGRLRVWEVAALAGMAAATAMSARHGVWLLLFLIAPAAIGLTRVVGAERRDAAPGPVRDGVTAAGPFGSTSSAVRLVMQGLVLGLAATAAITIVGRSATLAGPSETVDRIVRVAGHRVVLAPEPLAEDLAAAGVTVWVSNPIDAFQRADQAAYLDVWLGRGDGRRAIAESAVVVAAPESPAFKLAVSFGCAEVDRMVQYAILNCRA